MAVCSGIKRDGGRCTVVVGESQEYCYQHDPANSEKRRRAASKGGKSKPNRELADIKRRLSEMADTVLSGAVATAPYAVANQILNTQLRAIELERKVREQDELEARLEALEQAREGETRWGA